MEVWWIYPDEERFMTDAEIGAIKLRANGCYAKDIYALVDEVRRLRNELEKPEIDGIRLAQELRAAHNGIGGVYLYLGHDGDNVCTLKDFSAKPIGDGVSGRNLLEAVLRARTDWRNRKAMEKAADKKLGIVNEATPEGKCAVDAACVHQCLDEKGVPRADDEGLEYTLWGRVLRFVQSVGAK